MSAPPRRVIALPVTARRRPVEDTFDPAAHPARGFRLRRPDRLDRFHHQPNIYGLHRELAELRVDVPLQCRGPLRGVLRIAPADPMGRDELLGAGFEGDCLGRIELGGAPLALANLYRVQAIKPHLPAVLCPLARLGKAYGVQRPQPHLAQPASGPVAKYPTFCPASTDLEIQPSAIAVIAPALRPGHSSAVSLPNVRAMPPAPLSIFVP